MHRKDENPGRCVGQVLVSRTAGTALAMDVRIMNAAIATRAHDENSFVGQVLMRRTPVLTWRPAVVERLERERTAGHDGNEARIPMASSVRLTSSSKLPTRRVVAWPVVAKLAHHSRLSPRSLTVIRAAVAIVLGCSLGLFVLAGVRPLLERSSAAEALVGDAAVATGAPVTTTAAHVATTSKAAFIHVSGDPIDSLATPEEPEVAPVALAPAPAPRAPSKAFVAAPAAKPKAKPVAPTAAHAPPARRNARHGHR
jgi:hypothetical protein